MRASTSTNLLRCGPTEAPKLIVLAGFGCDTEAVSGFAKTASDRVAPGRYPNVWVKVSQLASVSKSGKYPFADAYPHVKRVYEAFGPQRLLFGTGYPGAARAAYDRPRLNKAIDLIRKEIPFFTAQDRENILGRNAASLWGFQ